MKVALVICYLLSLCSSLSAATWMLEIIPTYSSIDGKSIDTRNQAFVVLLTNTSDHDLSTWTQDYSWGYDNLSFLMVRTDGTSFRVSRKPELFTVNGAIPYLIKPHDHFAWAVTFSPDDWTGFPSDWKGSEDVSMKALFEIHETPESGRLKVWTGKIESPSIKVNLTRFLKQWYLKRSYSND